MSAQITHPPTDSFPFPEPAASTSSSSSLSNTFSLPNIVLTPGFFSLPSLANETWTPSADFPTPPPIPSWAIKPDPDSLLQQQQQQQSLQTDPTLQPSPPSSHHQSKSTSKSKSLSPLNNTRNGTKDQLKRESFLARNRKAASKCRQKKKQHNEALESQYEEVARRKKLLQAEAEHLRTEVLQLKDELLRHSQCDDVSIKGHLEKMVTQVANRSRCAGGGGGSTFIDVRSLLVDQESPDGSDKSGSGSGEGVSKSHTADSPLLQEVLDRERWRGGDQLGVVESRGDCFEILLNFA